MYIQLPGKKPLMVVFMTLVLGSANVFAVGNPDAPASIKGTTRVDAEKVIELAESIPDLLIVDSRIRMDRKQGFIEGSVSLPDIETDCKSLGKIISAKKAPVLFYCNGVKCGRSVNASREAVNCGYNNIYWFRGGFEEWKQKGFPFIKE